MNLLSYLRLVKDKSLTLVVIITAFFALGVALTLTQPLKYSSSLRLLVVQDVSSATADPYAVARSNEYLSQVLANIANSTSFYDRVMATPLAIDRGYFGQTTKQIAKQWNKTIDIKNISNTGIITVTAYHPNRDQAERIARGIGQVYITQHQNYHGLGDKVAIKLLDDPITSTYPVKPNLVVNMILASVLGALFGLAWIYLTAELGLDKLYQEVYPSQAMAPAAVTNWQAMPEAEVKAEEPLKPAADWYRQL